MELGSTSALIGLFGMLVPLVIHLLSKRKQTEIFFGSIQFLEETASDKSRSIQLSQPWLLITRMLIAGLLTLLVAALWDANDEESHQVYIPVELSEDPNYQSYLSQYEDEGFQVELYSHDHNNEQAYVPSLNALITTANAAADKVTILTFGFGKNVRGLLPQLSKEVEVIQVPIYESRYTKSIVIGDTSYQLIVTEGGQTNELLLETEDHADAAEELNICIIAAANRNEESDQLKNVISSLTPHIKFPIDYNCQASDWVITIDTLVNRNRTQTIEWDISKAPLSWINHGNHNYSVEGELSTQGFRSSNLPLFLAETLSSKKVTDDDVDFRTLDLEKTLIRTELVQNYASAGIRKNISQYFWIPLLLLLFGERMLSNRNRRTS